MGLRSKRPTRTEWILILLAILAVLQLMRALNIF